MVWSYLMSSSLTMHTGEKLTVCNGLKSFLKQHTYLLFCCTCFFTKYLRKIHCKYSDGKWWNWRNILLKFNAPPETILPQCISWSSGTYIFKEDYNVTKANSLSVIGGFQLEFVSISRVINHMTSSNSSALIGWNYSIQTGERIL